MLDDSMNRDAVALPQPHPANVPGDFYVEDGCCTMCEVPLIHAPDLFGVCTDNRTYPGMASRSYEHCYVKQPPVTDEQRDQMIEAIQFTELECIRYRGRDELIQLRLIEIGQGHVCDSLTTEQRELSRQTSDRLRRERRRPFWRRMLLRWSFTTKLWMRWVMWRNGPKN